MTTKHTTEDAFAYPFMYWVGMNTAPELEPEAVAEFSRFYSTVHLPEVLQANPGFTRGTRYELVRPDPRGDFGPRWLAIYEMDGEDAAQGYAARNDGPPEGRPKYTPGPPAWHRTESKWRLIWRRIVENGSTGEPPDTIFMVGMNVPPGTDEAALAEFNDFYTNTHLPEVKHFGGYGRATRHQLYREFKHPAPGSPQFVAIYEADASRDRPPGSGTKLSSGPPVWEAHDTLWRLVYRRIPTEEVVS